MMRLKPLLFAAVLAASSAPFSAQAKIVAYDVEIVIDELKPDSRFKIGDIHRPRIFFDEAMVDPVTKRAPLLHLQHAGGVPKHLDDVDMPMGNSFVDLSGPTIVFHYVAAPPPFRGDSSLISFDEKSQRFTSRAIADGRVSMSGKYTVKPTPVTGPDIDAVVGPPPLVGLNMLETVTDVYSPTSRQRVGVQRQYRLVYNPDALDAKTKQVKLEGIYLIADGELKVLNGSFRAVLDMSAQPYKLNFIAPDPNGLAVNLVWKPDLTRTVVRTSGDLVVRSRYAIDPKPIPMTTKTTLVSAAQTPPPAARPGA